MTYKPMFEKLIFQFFHLAATDWFILYIRNAHKLLNIQYLVPAVRVCEMLISAAVYCGHNWLPMVNFIQGNLKSPTIY